MRSRYAFHRNLCEKKNQVISVDRDYFFLKRLDIKILLRIASEGYTATSENFPPSVVARLDHLAYLPRVHMDGVWRTLPYNTCKYSEPEHDTSWILFTSPPPSGVRARITLFNKLISIYINYITSIYSSKLFKVIQPWVLPDIQPVLPPLVIHSTVAARGSPSHFLYI